MTWRIALALLMGTAVLLIGALAQGEVRGPIQVFGSYIRFDWPWVESCARQNDERCRIAVAARGSCR